MKKVAFITMFLLLGILVNFSFAIDVTLYGPYEFERTKGKPNEYTQTFTINGLSGEGRFIVYNGNHDKKTRVSSAEISFNGENILSQENFNKNVEFLEVPVELQEQNSFTVKLSSQPDSYLTVEIVKEVNAEAAAVIGPEGGIVEVTNYDSLLKGVKIQVLKETLIEKSIFFIALQDNPPDKNLPNDLIQEGTCISFQASVQEFKKPVFVFVPFENDFYDDEVRVLLTFNKLQEDWEIVAPFPSPDPKLFVARVSHFSDYVKGRQKISFTSISTGFDTKIDTHQYQNDNSVDCSYDPDGRGICNGMAVLASEYFNNWADNENIGLHCRWNVKTDADASCDARRRVLNEDLTQDEWIQKEFNENLEALGWLASRLDQSFVIQYIMFNSVMNNVVPIGMMGDFPNGKEGHAVVATGWNKTGLFTGDIEIYDVNHNDELRKITYERIEYPVRSITRLSYEDWNYLSSAFFRPIAGTNVDETVKLFEPEPNACDFLNLSFFKETTGYGFYVGDVNNDGLNELVLSDLTERKVNVFSYSSKSLSLLTELYTDNIKPISILIADPDKDGKNELIVGTSNSDSGGYVSVYEYNGNNFNIEWRSPLLRSFRWATELTVGDVNGNGRNEIITGVSWYGRYLVSYEFNGSGYSQVFRSNIGSDVDSVIATDVTGDGRDDLIVGTSCWGDYRFRVYDNYQLIYSHYNGGQTRLSAFDIDNDGIDEIIVGSGVRCGGYYTPAPSVKVFDYKNGAFTKTFNSDQLYSDWNLAVYTTAGVIDSEPVFVAGARENAYNRILLFKDYEIVWEHEFENIEEEVRYMQIANIDNHGGNELIVTTRNGLYVFTSR